MINIVEKISSAKYNCYDGQSTYVIQVTSEPGEVLLAGDSCLICYNQFMAFPGTYNFSYYKGDTLEFRVYPKDSTGAPFSLSGFAASFTISTARGAAGIPDQIPCFAEVSGDNTYILCTIRPTDGDQMISGTTYVYDIEISDSDITYDYDKVYTLLTGNISVTDQVTGAEVVS